MARGRSGICLLPVTLALAAAGALLGCGPGFTAGSGGSAVGGAGGSGGGLSCDGQYDQVPDYELCSEAPTGCQFNVLTNGSASCDDVCTDFGGECLQAWDNGTSCEILGPSTCSYSTYSTILCECSRGCGGGPPCQATQVCSNGSCS